MNEIISKIRNRCNTIGAKLSGARIGKRSVIHHTSEIKNAQGITMGDDAIIYKQASLYLGPEGKLSLGGHSHIAPFGFFLIDNNTVAIGKDVAIGPFCAFICHSNTYHEDKPLFRESFQDDDISLGNNVFVGAHCTFVPGAKVGDNVMIAANSVVKGELESNALYGGSPVKKLKSLEF
ncbi:MAG: acyltransferase [Bacteroidota bacterium]|nr:acyltransferase [Bacteroidota bacterium]